MSKSNIKENHSRRAGCERQGEDILQVRRKQKHAQSLVPGRSTRHTRRERPALIPGPPPRGAAPVRRAKKATHSRKEEGRRQGGEHEHQASDKRGNRSTAQKRASLRHGFSPIPATSRVAGAFGKEPSPRRRTPRQGDVVDR